MSESYVIAGPVFYAGLAGLVLVIALVLLLVFGVASASGVADQASGVKGSATQPSRDELYELERQGRHSRGETGPEHLPVSTLLAQIEELEALALRMEGRGAAGSTAYAANLLRMLGLRDELRRRGVEVELF